MTCGRRALTKGYNPCHRLAEHDGPCAHGLERRRWRFSYAWALSYLDMVILSTLVFVGLVVGLFDRVFGRARRDGWE